MIDQAKEIESAWATHKDVLEATANAAHLADSAMIALPICFMAAWKKAYASRYALPACSVRAKMAVEARIKALSNSSPMLRF